LNDGRLVLAEIEDIFGPRSLYY